MKARFLILLYFCISTVSLGAIEENSNPKQLFDALRQQMKKLNTLKANYTVDTIFGITNKNIKYKVSYSKSKDKFSMSEYGYDGDEQIEEARTVYDGIDIKRYDYIKRTNIQQGMIHSKDLLEGLSFRNSICELSGFSITKGNLDNRTFKNMGTEQINGHTYNKTVMISPYKPGQNAYDYFSIETRNDKYYLLKQTCLIDDDPNQLLYEKRFEYNYSDEYPIPRKIYHERFEIDDNKNRTLYYKLNVNVQNFQVQDPVTDIDFVYFFPEGTLIDISSASLNPRQITDPYGQNTSKQSTNVTEVNQPYQDKRTEFPFGEGSGAILIPVHIQGQEYLFMVDTGSSFTIFDASLRKLLRAPKKTGNAGTPANPIRIQIFESPEISVGPYKLQKGSEITSLDLGRFSMVDGRKISGILGMDFIKNHIIQIDFDKGILSFPEPGKVDYSLSGQKIDLISDTQGRPKIKGIILDNTDVDFVVDTGNISSGMLDSKIFSLLIEQKDIKVNETIIAMASGTVKSQEIRLMHLTIENFEYKDLVFGEGNENFLGLDFLSRHIVTLDFPNKIMYLKKGTQFAKNDESGMSGLALIHISDKLTVYSVDSSSPAEKAGLLAGDIIVKIEGKNTADYTVKQLRQLLRSGEGKRITLTIERNDQLKETIIVLEKKI
jgi:predicted aspartyl protease